MPSGVRKRLETVVITRPEGPYSGAVQLASLVRAEGLRPFGMPVLSCEVLSGEGDDQQDDAPHWKELVQHEGAWLAFLSPTAVHVCAQLCQRGRGIPVHTMIAAQGSGTAKAVEECFGRVPDFVPTVFVAEVFAAELLQRIREQHAREGGTTGEKLGPVVIPQSADGRDIVGPTLRKAGIPAEAVSLYRLVPTELPAAVLDEFLSLDPATAGVVFMSPSAVRATVQALGADGVEALREMEILSVGPITTQALKEVGLPVSHEAREHSEAGIIELLKGYVGGRLSDV